MAYPQNGDRIVATDFVTSLHPMYTLLLQIRKQPDIPKALITTSGGRRQMDNQLTLVCLENFSSIGGL